MLTGVACVDAPHAVKSMKLVVNQLDEQQSAIPTDSTETVQCGLVLRSIGYRSKQADPDVPFDASRGRVPNTSGVIQPGKCQSLIHLRSCVVSHP